MRLAFFAFALLSGCAVCRASSGLEWAGFYGKPVPNWGCAEFRAAHDKAVRAFQAVGDERLRKAYVGYWRAYTMPEKSFTSFLTGERPVGGLANCFNSTLFVGSQAPLSGALAHEFAHALQGCDAKCEKQPEDADDFHACWYSRGIWQALEVISRP